MARLGSLPDGERQACGLRHPEAIVARLAKLAQKALPAQPLAMAPGKGERA
jgi:hypothetical protein